jgi:hypothetical protein
MRKRVIVASIVAVCLLLAGVSLFAVVDGWFGPIIVSMRASRGIFEGGVIAGPTDQQDFLAIIALTPAEEREGAKLMRYLRTGCFVVSLRLSEEPDQPPILVSDATKGGEVIIRCKNIDEANKIIYRLHAGPGQKKT